MLSILNNVLHVTFPDLSPQARLRIGLQRTLRLPDDNQTYPLPPNLGSFPLQHVDDFAERLPASWKERGGTFFPMWQSEALWLSFNAGDYPFAIKVAAGKINAVDGQPWSNDLHANDGQRTANVPQDYMVVPGQRWLDGFNVGQGTIRQFVAMPLGQCYTAEEQITGQAEHGGLQIIVYPMKKEAYDAMKAHEEAERVKRRFVGSLGAGFMLRSLSVESMSLSACESADSAPDMGLAAGGLMTQDIHKDRFGLDAWDLTRGVRCFVHIANSQHYQAITGQVPPTVPPLAKDYRRHNLPWFHHYSDLEALPGSSTLAQLDSVAALGVKKQTTPLPDNTSVSIDTTVAIGPAVPKKGIVRNGAW